jgi:Tfp pilus assembly protein PilZ
MFVSLDEPPRPRELVRVDAVLPEGDRLTLQGMVAFVTSKDDDVGRPRGVGIRFLGSGGPEHDQWEGFVRKVWDEQHRRKPKVKRTGGHVAVVVRLRAKDTAELEDGIASVLSHGGLPVETEHRLVVGGPLALEIVHPHTGEVFDLPCVVRKRADGVSVGLADVGTEQKRALAEFVSSGAKAPSRR